jgi:hypothetical protein
MIVSDENRSKTIYDMTTRQRNELLNKLEMSIDTDWEHIVTYFHDVFPTDANRNHIKRLTNSPNSNVSHVILDSLMQYRVEISRLYDCCLSNQMVAALELLERECNTNFICF